MFRALAPLLAAVLLLLIAAPPLHAQSGDPEADRVARADAVRDTLTLPPGDLYGLTALDVVKVPFNVFGATLATGYTVAGGVLLLVERLGVLPGARQVREDVADEGLLVGVDFIGQRSWPAVVLTWERWNPLFLQAGVSVRGYQLYRGGVRLGDTLGGALAAASWRSLREPHFFGVGPGSAEGDRSDFAMTRTEVGARLWERFGTPLTFSVAGGWERTDVGRGTDDDRPDLQDVFDPQALYGAAPGDEPTYAHVEGSLHTRRTGVRDLFLVGAELGAAYHVFRGVDGTDSDFQRAEVEAIGYVPLAPRHVLAARGLLVEHLAEDGEGVPFFHLARLGGEQGLRGYGGERFRDRALLALQTELRYEVWWHGGLERNRVEAFVFGDVGAVAPALEDVRARDFRFSPGFGLRLTEDGGGLIETYVAWGEGVRFDLELGVSF